MRGRGWEERVVKEGGWSNSFIIVIVIKMTMIVIQTSLIPFTA